MKKTILRNQMQGIKNQKSEIDNVSVIMNSSDELRILRTFLSKDETYNWIDTIFERLMGRTKTKNAAMFKRK